jgi:hypothetical protein
MEKSLRLLIISSIKRFLSLISKVNPCNSSRLREDNDKTKKDVSLLQVMKGIIFILIEFYEGSGD